MPFSSKYIVRTWLCITVISITAVIVLGFPKEKTFDLKIGFDLTQGANGAPSLRIRNFEDSSELNQRAKDDDSPEESTETKPTVRADSSSAPESEDTEAKRVPPPKSVSSKERDSSGKSDDENDSDYSGEDKLSTRGLKAADYEPDGKRGEKK